MSWLQDYKDRVNFSGANIPDRIEQNSIDFFERDLKFSPSTVDIAWGGQVIPAMLITSKNTDNKVTKTLLTGKGTGIQIGDRFEWGNYPAGSPRKHWFVISDAVYPRSGYDKHTVVQCNHFIKWVDKYGVVNKEPAFASSSMYNILRNTELVRVQNIVATLPNTNIQVIMPTSKRLLRTSRIILGEEAWAVVDFDNISIPNLYFFSLAEDRKNTATDELVSVGDPTDLANSATVGKAKIELLPRYESQIGTTIRVTPTLKIDGLVVENAVFSFTENGATTTATFMDFSSSVATSIPLQVSAPNQPNLSAVTLVDIVAVSTAVVSIKGADVIRQGRKATYTCVSVQDGVETALPAVFAINDPTLASLTAASASSVTLTGATSGNVGSLVLSCVVNGNTLTKAVEVKTLW